MISIVDEGVIEAAPRNCHGELGVNVEHLYDSFETGRRGIYWIVELCVYFGIPVIIALFISFLYFELDAKATLCLSAVMMAWPLIKNWSAKLAGRLMKEDYRIIARSSSFWFDGFLIFGSSPLREIRRFSSLSRSLDVIYNFFGQFGVFPRLFPNSSRFVSCPIRLINRVIEAWTRFWIGMPIAQDVRTRLDLVAEEYLKGIRELSFTKPGKTINILEIAGGQLQAVIMGISRAKEEGLQFEYFVVSIEPDVKFARVRALELIDRFGLDRNHFRFISSYISMANPKRVQKTLTNEGMLVGSFDFVVSIGLSDYYSAQRIVKLLSQLGLMGDRIIVANISDNFIERFFLHYFIQWPQMYYRSLEEWVDIVAESFKGRKIKIVQTPHKIFNVAVVR